MRNSVWLRAAKAIAKNRACSCCWAIEYASRRSGNPDTFVHSFEHVFKPRLGENGYGQPFWWSDGRCCCHDETSRTPRVLALLLMHWMEESGDA